MNPYSEWSDDQVNREVVTRTGIRLDYAYWMNDAIKLLAELNYGQLSSPDFAAGEQWIVSCSWNHKNYEVENANPARAICEAWLMWRDAQA